MIGFEAGIVGRDQDALLPFYQKVMQFEIAQRLKFSGSGELVKLRRDAARLKIFFPEVEPATQSEFDPYWELAGWRYAALLFDSRDEMRDLFARIATSSGRIVTPPFGHRANAEAGIVADPEGNHWELLWERSRDHRSETRT